MSTRRRARESAAARLYSAKCVIVIDGIELVIFFTVQQFLNKSSVNAESSDIRVTSIRIRAAIAAPVSFRRRRDKKIPGAGTSAESGTIIIYIVIRAKVEIVAALA
jgi:hypothetical protein